jgi:hypothetical protein
MTTTSTSSDATIIRWSQLIEYDRTGFERKILLEDENYRYTLIPLDIGTLVQAPELEWNTNRISRQWFRTFY